MKIYQSQKVRLPKIRFRENCILQFYFVFLNNGFFICLDSRNLILVRAYQGGVLVHGCDRAWRVGVSRSSKNAGLPILYYENAVNKSNIQFPNLGRHSPQISKT